LEKPQSFVSAYERGQRRVDVLELLLILRAIKADPQLVFAKIVGLARPTAHRNLPRRRKASG
jgi:hypothetical protein